MNSELFNKIETLSYREREVLDLLLKGDRTINISKKLLLKPNTISTFKKLIYKKLGVDNLIDLYVFMQLFNLNNKSNQNSKSV